MEFEAIHDALGALVRAPWPEAMRKTMDERAYTRDAYATVVPNPPAKDTWRGTMPRDVFVVAPTQNKAGITIHIWHPNHPYLLKENADWLKEARYKPMVGCLQGNRKAPTDLDALGKLLDLVP